MTVGIRAESPHSQGQAVGRGQGGASPKGEFLEALADGAGPPSSSSPARGCTRGAPTMSRAHSGTRAARRPLCSEDAVEPGLKRAGRPARGPGSSAALHGHCPSLTASPAQFPTLAGQGPPSPNTGRTPGSGLKLRSPPCQPGGGPGQHETSAPAPRSPREAQPSP